MLKNSISLFIKPTCLCALSLIKRVNKSAHCLTEGEDERILYRATGGVAKIGVPILVGHKKTIEERLQAQGLTIRAGKDFELIDINDNPHFEESWKEYYQLRKRKGVTEEMARRRVRANSTLIGALMVRLGYADGLLCGTMGRFYDHFGIFEEVIGYKNNPERHAFAMNALISNRVTSLLLILILMKTLMRSSWQKEH